MTVRVFPIEHLTPAQPEVDGAKSHTEHSMLREHQPWADPSASRVEQNGTSSLQFKKAHPQFTKHNQ